MQSLSIGELDKKGKGVFVHGNWHDHFFHYDSKKITRLLKRSCADNRTESGFGTKNDIYMPLQTFSTFIRLETTGK